MSVQPLKSIAIAAIATGATATEVRVSGALLGLVCLTLITLDINSIAKKVPHSLIHCLQLALGLLLIRQGIDSALPSLATIGLISLGALVAALILVPRYTGVPLLGVAATAGLIWATVHPVSASTHAHVSSALSPAHVDHLRLAMVAGLTLPQIALTLGNSVLGTYDVAQRAFGERAKRVTVSRLLTSIGIGNLLSASIGGLPFCHGSGGLTAHIRGGAHHWRANAIIGTSLLLLALISALGGQVKLVFPPLLLGSLLAATGLFHMELAKPTWARSFGKTKLVFSGATILLTRNMLWVSAVAVALELGEAHWRRRTLGRIEAKEMAA
jgi:hypothetical protein